PGTSADVALAFAAASIDPADVSTDGGTDLLSYLRASAGDVAVDPGLAAKMALALHAAGADPRDAGGIDLIAAIESGFDSQTGWYGMSFYGHALAVLALHASGATVPDAAVEAIV